MKNDLIKLLVFIWLVSTAYFIYSIWVDLSYITELVHAYISMVVQHARR